MYSTSHGTSHFNEANVKTPERQRNHALRNKWRQRLFRFWVGGSAVVALYLMLGGPLTVLTGLEKPAVALVVVPFMVLLLASGLVWLVLLVHTRR